MRQFQTYLLQKSSNMPVTKINIPLIYGQEKGRWIVMLNPNITNEDTFKRLCYMLYKEDYIKSHYLSLINRGIPVTDYDSFLFDCCFSCFEEFLDNEYQDKEIMEDILNSDYLFILYKFYTTGEDVSLLEDEFSDTNPMFIAFVKLISELCNKGIVKKDKYNDNNVLIYKTNLDPSIYLCSEGLVSENIFRVAEELFRSKENRANLYNALMEEHSLVPVFTKNGDFDKFIKAF